ncbi:MAG: enoyl-CoA hydratase/carnithine racemase [Mycobacterium sp.]|nr:enoyl-CoA hydratase/carnithine racemase [Mycobacterium sp.]
MRDFDTLSYEEKDGVAWVTLNRPELHNAFNFRMLLELREVWVALRSNDDVKVAVLTGAGEKAFCVGQDRNELRPNWGNTNPENRNREIRDDELVIASGFMYDDPGKYIGPKACDLWKPVIAAVNGMACGGAFYMLGESDFLIAGDNATFFDPHVTYGMPTTFEPIHMLQRMPLGEIMRISLLGNAERMSAARAYQVGLVSEVVPAAELHEAAAWAAGEIAALPTLPVQATVRAIWTGREMGRSQALSMAGVIGFLGTEEENLGPGQASFASGQRKKWRLR